MSLKLFLPPSKIRTQIGRLPNTNVPLHLPSSGYSLLQCEKWIMLQFSAENLYDYILLAFVFLLWKNYCKLEIQSKNSGRPMRLAKDAQILCKCFCLVLWDHQCVTSFMNAPYNATFLTGNSKRVFFIELSMYVCIYVTSFSNISYCINCE